MKSTFNGINFLILYIILSTGKVISLIDFTYPSALGLSTGNVFVVEKKGIYVYDGQLNNIIYSYPFEEGEQIDSIDTFSKVVIKSKLSHIICLINKRIYLFDYEGKFLAKTEKLISETNYEYPTLAVPFNEGNNYYYVILYFINSSGIKQRVLYNKINVFEKKNYPIKELTLNQFETKTWGGLSSDSYDFYSKGLTCEYMQCENDDYIYLICFMIVNKDTYSLSLNYFEISTSSISTNKKFKATFLEVNDVKQIQSVSREDKKYSLVCLLFANHDLSCYKFHFESHWNGDDIVFSDKTTTDFYCRIQPYAMKLNYLGDGEKIILSCINSGSIVQAWFFRSNLDSISSNAKRQFIQCSEIYGHSVIQYSSSYYVVSDVICERYKRCYEPLEGPLSPIIIIETTQIEKPLIEEEVEEKIEEVEEKVEEEEQKSLEEEKIEDMEVELGKERFEEEKIEETIIEIEEKEKTDIIEKKFDCSNLEKCEECDQESFDKNLCIKCNHQKNYYYLNYFPSEPRKTYIDCIQEKYKPPKFYFNKKNLDYEPCYTSCASCEYGGNNEINNCTSCDGINYIKNPENENSSNCLIKCRYFYYLEHEIYTCTETPFCPEEYNYIITNKSKCTNNCRNDKEYKYRYNGECFKECPNKTKDDNDYICKDISTSECLLTENDANFLNENTNFEDIEKLVIKYIDEFNYTNTHVSLYKNKDYTITIYIKNKCILELGLGIPEIDFGSCYEKMKNNEESNNGELIIAIIDKKIDTKNTRKVIKYGMFSPLTGNYLNSEEICREDKITIVNTIEEKLAEAKVNIDTIREFVNEGIDIFNMTSPFYNDICFQYNSKKDIALKDRIFEYFPNRTLCEEGCDLKGINMTSITAICECFYSESKKEENLKDKVMDQAQIGILEEMISKSNIYVIKCISLVLETNNFKKCYGGFFILGLFIIELIFTIIYCKKNIYSINKYIFCITNKYISHLLKQKSSKLNNNNKHNITNKPKIISTQNINKINAPPKGSGRKSIDYMKPNIRKPKVKSKSVRKPFINQNFNLIINNKDSNVNNNYDFKKPNNMIHNNKKEDLKNNKIPIVYNSKNFGDNSYSNSKDIISVSKNGLSQSNNYLFMNINDNLDIDIEEYLETQYDDMDYDDAIRKDHRKFCTCYIEKLKDNQLIINTFFSDEPIRPKSIKIIFLILQIDLYFFINGLFYHEEYISKIYHLEKDTFFTMAERFFDNLIYAALAGIIVNYIIEFIFIEEQKIKKILKIEKDNILILKYEVIKILKSIKTRYIFFIIISFIIYIIALVHTFCFNIVYYHTMVEWIAFSLIIILSTQIGSFLICLLQTALRFISFKIKSEKLFKLSL